MNSSSNFEVLYQRYLTNQLSQEELQVFLEQLQEREKEEQMARLMEETWQEMYEVHPVEKPLVRGKFLLMIAAAAMIGLIAVASYFIMGEKEPKTVTATLPPQEVRFKNDVQPGSKVPELILADGRILNLDSALKGSLATEGSVKVKRLENGEIIYDATGNTSEVRFNTINNPKGSKLVTLVLADGSKLWLDAASSIRYPTAFVAKERRVEITGQAYFEVAHNPTKPFRVQTGEMEVLVLGTHFNIMSFEEEGVMKTTLLEGKVKIKYNNRLQTLAPGQQGQISESGNLTVSSNVDLEQVMAWKNGLFSFQDASIETIMKQIARWYDVEVVYQEGVPVKQIRGKASRNTSLVSLLKVLELSGVHFKVDGNRITVMP